MSSITTELAEILDSVKRPGNFFATGVTELYPPQLEVTGVGLIALPLLPVQAEQLIAVAERAPYGRGEETLLDTEVRRTWQIAPDRVHIGGRHWPQTLAAIIEHCTQDLGVSGSVASEFYKLLVYDEGSFFVSHRDTEKAPGMFATLIIVLPSPHSGGELLVRHRDQQVRLDLGDTEPSEVTYAAFYADCVHEVLPLTSGYRLALVYNLIRKGKAKPPKPPEYAAEQSQITGLLKQWTAAKRTSDEESSEKLIYLLEHAYTPAELSFAALKGADAARAAVLVPAAASADCDLHLTLLTIEESGSAEYYGYYGSRRGRWSMPDDDEFEIIEVTDQSKTLANWRRPDDSPSGWGEIPFMGGELCPPDSMDNLEPDEQHFHEATGNEGASFERTYRRAALVLWPRERTLAVLNQAGLPATLPYLSKLAQDWTDQGGAAASPLWQQAHELAGHMLRTWSIARWHPYQAKSSNSAQMLICLAQLQDVAHIETFLSNISAQGDYHPGDNPALVAALVLLAKPRAAELIKQVIAANAVTALKPCAELLALCTTARPFDDHPATLTDAAKALVESLPGDPARAPQVQPWLKSKADAGSVVNLISALERIHKPLAEQTADYILAWPEAYDLDGVLVPAVLALPAENRTTAAGRRLLEACLAHLRARIAEPLAPPSDWTREHKLGCRCADCSDLSRFLADPEHKVWTLKAAQQRRSHVESTIRSSRCDVDTKTSTQGRPYTLICTKNQASYQRRARQREQDLEHLARLE